MARLFFLVSGEHKTLPFSELRAVLEAERQKYRVVGTHSQIMRLEADPECTAIIVKRAALTRVCCAEVVFTSADVSAIVQEVNSAPFENWIHRGQGFVVRVRRIGESAPDVDSMALEKKIGAIVLDSVAGSRVKLGDPDVTLFGVITDDRFIFGVKLAEIPAKPYVERRPRKRVFFHPSAMPAKLARCLVNLAQPKVGDIVLDPFCGTGSFLIEAGLMGCSVVGFDVQRRMVRGTYRNLRYYGVSPDGVFRADARYPPVRRVDCIVTDPPYGRSATTLGRDVGEIVGDFLMKAKDSVLRGRRVCIAFPKGTEIEELAKKSGFSVVESHFVYVHRSLTREIAVLERV